MDGEVEAEVLFDHVHVVAGEFIHAQVLEDDFEGVSPPSSILEYVSMGFEGVDQQISQI